MELSKYLTLSDYTKPIVMSKSLISELFSRCKMIFRSRSEHGKEKRLCSHGDSTTKKTPLVSIVTPSFNQAGFIHDALQSTQTQSYSNYEHLVIDGMSTDGTVELLQHLSILPGWNK